MVISQGDYDCLLVGVGTVFVCQKVNYFYQGPKTLAEIVQVFMTNWPKLIAFPRQDSSLKKYKSANNLLSE